MHLLYFDNIWLAQTDDYFIFHEVLWSLISTIIMQTENKICWSIIVYNKSYFVGIKNIQLLVLKKKEVINKPISIACHENYSKS